MKKFFNAQQIAKLEDITATTVVRWIRDGKFDGARKVGREYRVPLESYYAWRESTKLHVHTTGRSNERTFGQANNRSGGIPGLDSRGFFVFAGILQIKESEDAFGYAAVAMLIIIGVCFIPPTAVSIRSELGLGRYWRLKVISLSFVVLAVFAGVAEQMKSGAGDSPAPQISATP